MHKVTEISTTLNLQYGSGKSLEKIGFVRGDIEDPKCFWIHKSNVCVIYNSVADESKAIEAGYRRIWDCGYVRYTYSIG
jgi:hypothetical protein